MSKSPDTELPDGNEELEDLSTYVPSLRLQQALHKYSALGSCSSAISLQTLKQPRGNLKAGNEWHTTTQLKHTLDIRRGNGTGISPDYESKLRQELLVKKARVEAARTVLRYTDKNYRPRNPRNRADAARRLEALRDDMEYLLSQHVKKLVQRDQDLFPHEANQVVHSDHVFLLRARIAALKSSIEGDSFEARGGIRNLPSPILNFSLAARHLHRYTVHLIQAKKQVASDLIQVMDDIAFENRLKAELKSINSLVAGRMKRIESEREERLTPKWIKNTIEHKKKEAERECKRLMSSLRYLIQSHLAPYISLHAYRLPDISTASNGSNSKKRQKTFSSLPGRERSENLSSSSKFVIAEELQMEQDFDLTDSDQISERLQSVLLSLLIQSVNSSSDKKLYIQVSAANDPIVRFLLAADVVVQPKDSPQLIYLRNFGRPIET